MEFERSRSPKPDYMDDLDMVFGQAGTDKLLNQIAFDTPSLSKEAVVAIGWSLIGEACAYMMPATQADLTDNAVLIHEVYLAEERAKDYAPAPRVPDTGLSHDKYALF